MVTVDGVDPSATTGPLPEMLELAEVGKSEEKVTVLDPVTAIGEVN